MRAFPPRLRYFLLDLRYCPLDLWWSVLEFIVDTISPTQTAQQEFRASKFDWIGNGNLVSIQATYFGSALSRRAMGLSIGSCRAIVKMPLRSASDVIYG